jgi:aminoglycoside phosphotransferase (APT) family kinase protein
MAGHPEELPLLGGVAALLGASVFEHAGAGPCRVLSGGGLVAKIGPPDVVAREAAVLAAPLPVSKPVLVDTGPGWLVMTAEPDDEGPWAEDELGAALADLARLHDAFEAADAPMLADPHLRWPFSAQGADLLLEPVRRLGFDLPVPLARVLDDPVLLLAAAGEEPATLLHGDPWPGNVLRPSSGRRVWIDWEMAGVGPAAADIATWLGQTPWHGGVAAGALGGREVEIYLSSRSRPVDRVRFERALHAAAVLWFLAYDVPHLAAGVPADRAATLIPAALAALDRLEAG